MKGIFGTITILAIAALIFVFFHLSPENKGNPGEKKGSPSSGKGSTSPATPLKADTLLGYLVKDGKPWGEVVGNEDAHSAEIFAAKELCIWVEEMTGAETPLNYEPSTDKNLKIFVGKSFASQWKSELETLSKTDGFAIRRKDNNIYIFGDRPRGTLYGVYAFLENNSEIIWARPNFSFGTVFGKGPDFKLEKVEVLEKPVFKLRGWNICSLRGDKATGVWEMRNRANLPVQTPVQELDSIIPYGGFEGLLPSQVAKEYFKSNPEYFAWDKFQKTRSTGAFCLNTPGLPDIVVKEAVTAISKMPVRPEQADIGMNDTWRVCHCEECMKPIKLKDGSLLEPKDATSEKDPVFRSTQYFMFMNKVAERWQKTMPDIELTTLSYIYAAEPPLCELNPNLRIMFAPYPTNNERLPLLHPDQDKVWRTRFEKWGELTKNLAFYQYYSPNMRHLAKTASIDLRQLQKFGGAGIVSECGPDVPKLGEGSFHPLSYNWDINPIEPWVLNRLFWDPNQDVDALRKYYIKRAFREAAPAMEKYYSLFLSGFEDPNDKTFTNCHASDSNVFRIFIVDKNLEEPCRNALIEAEQTAKNPNSLKLIQAIRRRFEMISDSLGRIMVANLPEAEKAGAAFDSPLWEKLRKLDEFKVPYSAAIYGKKSNEATEESELRIMNDGKNLYIRFIASDKDPAKASASALHENAESWPKGDHAEIWFKSGNILYTFAFDCNGNKYDAKNWDKTWDSGWRLKTRKTKDAWEAIAVIPLSDITDIGFKKEDQKTRLKSFFLREYAHGSKFPEESSFKGGIILKHYYELILE
ncbi:MAG: hypothetical protein A2X49_08055 [Lentisphaerae bacterium GWF2_52_8]|nr:MAG: hypothetical protein A2X49_08055 [Lentisphaerae bacterium GWF2_52_8]